MKITIKDKITVDISQIDRKRRKFILTPNSQQIQSFATFCS